MALVNGWMTRWATVALVLGRMVHQGALLLRSGLDDTVG